MLPDFKTMALKKRLNTLADQLYQEIGNRSRPEFDYEQSPHPLEKLMFIYACLAYQHFEGDSPDWRGEEEDEDLCASGHIL
jgi:hypothetical protein